jgi:hypothetical protein
MGHSSQRGEPMNGVTFSILPWSCWSLCGIDSSRNAARGPSRMFHQCPLPPALASQLSGSSPTARLATNITSTLQARCKDSEKQNETEHNAPTIRRRCLWGPLQESYFCFLVKSLRTNRHVHGVDTARRILHGATVKHVKR